MLNVGITLKKRTIFAPIVIILALLVNIGLNFWLIPRYGITGATISTLISYLVFCALRYWASNMFFKVHYEWSRVFTILAVGSAMIGAFYLMAGVFAYFVGQSLGEVTLLATLVLLAGMCVNGAQSAMPSLAARFYPTQGRATGVSWMLGIGRFGAILGAWIGATLLGLGWNFEQVLTALVVPAAIATTAVVIKGLVSHADAT